MPLQPLVLAFVGEQNQGALSWGSSELCRRFEARGYVTAILNLKQSAQTVEEMKRLCARHELRFAFAFAGLGSTINIAGHNFWDLLKVPHISLMADLPAYNPTLHAAQGRFTGRIYRAKDFYDTQQKYLRSPGPSLLLPPEYQMNPAPPETRWVDRPIDYLFLKNGVDPAAIAGQWAHCDADVQSVIWDCIAACRQRTDLLIADLAAERIGLAPADCNERSENFWVLVRLIDQYVRAERMTWMVEFLKNQPVTIIGDFWDHVDKTGARARFLPAVAATATPRLYQQTKFMFNTNPYYDHNVHERVVIGLASHCRVVTDENACTRHYLSRADGLVGFDWADPHKGEKIREGVEAAYRLGPPTFDPRLLAAMGDPESYPDEIIAFADQIRAQAQAQAA